MLVRRHLHLVVSLIVLAGCGSTAPTLAIDDARLREADSDTANWLTHGRTYSEQRFSPLNQITEQNVSRLGLVWSRELDTTRGLEATPLVLDGVIYTTGPWSVVYALDARPGDLLWTYDPKVSRARARVICCDVVNRGLALYRGKVYVGTLDGRLIAIDVKSGMPVRAPPSSAIELRASAATLKEGAALFESFCAPCHGFSAIAGPIADLRYATADVHRAFEAIVLGGALEQRGMPSFGDLLTTDQARAIQAYVLSRAAEASKGR